MDTASRMRPMAAEREGPDAAPPIGEALPQPLPPFGWLLPLPPFHDDHDILSEGTAALPFAAS